MPFKLNLFRTVDKLPYLVVKGVGGGGGWGEGGGEVRRRLFQVSRVKSSGKSMFTKENVLSKKVNIIGCVYVALFLTCMNSDIHLDMQLYILYT